MTNPQLLQPQHSQSIRSSALKSNKNVCTADKLGFVLDTSTHTLELSEAFTELLTEAAKHAIESVDADGFFRDLAQQMLIRTH